MPPLDATLRLLRKASGLSVAELATAIPRAGIDTVNACSFLAAPASFCSAAASACARAGVGACL